MTTDPDGGFMTMLDKYKKDALVRFVTVHLMLSQTANGF